MSPRTILLADADADSRAVYGLMLEHHGFQVLQARDTREALRLACEGRPDLIVADLFLPTTLSQPVAALLRQDPCTAELPVIGLTSLPVTMGVAPGLLVCDSYLVKPCTPSRLLREVERLLGAPAPLRRPGYRSRPFHCQSPPALPGGAGWDH